MKRNIIKVILALIFLVLFNVLFFVIGGAHQPKASWISYGFIHAAYFCLLATPLFGKAGKGLTVLTATLYLLATIYFFIELVIGVVIILIAPQGIAWPLAIQAVLLALFLILQLTGALANDATVRSIQEQKKRGETDR